MNCLTHVSSYTAAIFRRTSHLITNTSLCRCSTPSWKTNFERAGVKTIDLEFLLTRFRAQCYSTRKGAGGKKSRKTDPEPVMEQEKDAFFVVRKGDVVGVYKSLSDCQAQVGSSICDPPVSVYKGYSFPKETEEYLVSRGLKNALYTIRAADLTEDIFGTLMPCPFQDPASSIGEISSKDASKKRSQDMLGSETVEAISSTSVSTDPLRKHVKLDHHAETQAASSHSVLSSCGTEQMQQKSGKESGKPLFYCLLCQWLNYIGPLAGELSTIYSCTLEFDGASKGNPGQAGAGAVLRADDGSLICRLREGLGVATNNVAEYRAMILGLKYALKKGYTKIRVRGDSKLVCMQIQGLWKIKNPNMSDLCEEAKKLKDKFLSFKITHVLRDLNSEADAQANLAISLADGQVQEEI